MNYLLWNLLGPASWAFWLILVAAIGVAVGRDRIVRFAVALAALWVAVFALLPTGFWLMQTLEADYPRVQQRSGMPQQIVVLAGAERLRASAYSGRLELNAHAERVTEAAILARTLPKARLWIVGGVSRKAQRDIDLTAAYWADAGIAPGRIGKIGDTTDTCENASGIARRLGIEPVLLVTSAFHMPRALACMARAGVNAVPYPVDTQIWQAEGIVDMFSSNLAANAERTALALHEYAGMLYYRITKRL